MNTRLKLIKNTRYGRPGREIDDLFWAKWQNRVVVAILAIMGLVAAAWYVTGGWRV